MPPATATDLIHHAPNPPLLLPHSFLPPPPSFPPFLCPSLLPLSLPLSLSLFLSLLPFSPPPPHQQHPLQKSPPPPLCIHLTGCTCIWPLKPRAVGGRFPPPLSVFICDRLCAYSPKGVLLPALFSVMCHMLIIQARRKPEPLSPVPSSLFAIIAAATHTGQNVPGGEGPRLHVHEAVPASAQRLAHRGDEHTRTVSSQEPGPQEAESMLSLCGTLVLGGLGSSGSWPSLA